MITWDVLKESYVSNNVAGGIILNGETIDDALAMAQRFAELLLCQNSKDGDPCGKCDSCNYIKAESHPGLGYITKEEGSDVIKIEQIRELIAKLHLLPMYSLYKVMIIVGAESINEMAINALLKTLEEPPGMSTIMLVTTRADSIPATIKSRCISLNVASSKVDLGLNASEHDIAFASFLTAGNKEKMISLIESDFALYKAVVDCFLLQKISIRDAFDKDTDIADVVTYSHKLAMICLKMSQGCKSDFIPESEEVQHVIKCNYNSLWYAMYDYHMELMKQLLSPVALNLKGMLLDLNNTWRNLEREVELKDVWRSSYGW